LAVVVERLTARDANQTRHWPLALGSGRLLVHVGWSTGGRGVQDLLAEASLSGPT